jgi:hypothetical protein
VGARVRVLRVGGKTFQKRRVSSPAPVTIVWPSGDIDKYSTRVAWPCTTMTMMMFHGSNGALALASVQIV